MIPQNKIEDTKESEHIPFIIPMDFTISACAMKCKNFPKIKLQRAENYLDFFKFSMSAPKEKKIVGKVCHSKSLSLNSGFQECSTINFEFINRFTVFFSMSIS